MVGFPGLLTYPQLAIIYPIFHVYVCLLVFDFDLILHETQMALI